MAWGIQMANTCSLFYPQAESMDHLFLHCLITSSVWLLFIARFKRSWIMLESIASLLRWNGERVGDLLPRGRVLWSCNSFIVCWSVWMEHNARIFERVVCDPLKLPVQNLALLFCWVSHLSFKRAKYNDWIFDLEGIVSS